MSPLASLLMRVLRSGAWAAAVVLVVFLGIMLWQRVTPDGGLALNRQDYGFAAVVLALLVLAAYLVRAIGKEIKRSGG